MSAVEGLLADATPDLGPLLDEVAAYLRRYVVMSEAQAVAVALWVAHTHAFDAAEATPYLHITSVEKESGKTRLLEALDLLVARSAKFSTASTAALARSAAQKPPPAMLIDESDNTFKRDREYVAALMGVLNDGYRKGGQTLLCLPPRWEPSYLPVFCPKALAGIGELPDTVASRSIRIELKRRTPDEPLARFRFRDASAEAEPLRIAMEAWAAARTDGLADARPSLPDELSDRGQDVWEPLLAIADTAGEEWGARARRAAVELSARDAEEDGSAGVQLLGHVRDAFDGDRMTCRALCDALNANEEMPYGGWNDGRGITTRELGRKLKPYSIRARSVRLDDGTTPKGYRREQFEDAWNRYVPASDAGNSHTATTRMDTGLEASSQQTHNDDVSVPGTAANPHGYDDVAVVSVAEPEEGPSGRDDPPLRTIEEQRQLVQLAIDTFDAREIPTPEWAGCGDRPASPLLGDPEHTEFLRAAYDAGHVTGTEAVELLHLHKLAAEGRAA